MNPRNGQRRTPSRGRTERPTRRAPARRPAARPAERPASPNERPAPWQAGPPAAAPAGGLRLQVYLARCGLGSRRGCEQLILDGRVEVDGRKVGRFGTRVAGSARVTVDGRVVRPTSSQVYLALHKPRGYICSNADPEGRPLASDLFRGAVKERLFHVGRLDFLSTGLIFYTNDGEFGRLITHPGSRIEKEYLVETARPVEEAFMEQYRKGFWIEGVRYRCERYELHNPRSVTITLLEGKNRELRTVFTARRIRIKRVHRIRIGNITLRGLQPGRFRRLTEREVRWFYDHGNSDGSSD